MDYYTITHKDEGKKTKRVGWLLHILRQGLNQIIHTTNKYIKTRRLRDQNLELAELHSLRGSDSSVWVDADERQAYNALVALAQQHGIAFEAATEEDMRAHHANRLKVEQDKIKQELEEKKAKEEDKKRKSDEHRQGNMEFDYMEDRMVPKPGGARPSAKRITPIVPDLGSFVPDDAYWEQRMHGN